jgi:putative protease
VKFGEVVRIGAGNIEIRPTEAHAISPLKAGDGVVFDSASWRSPQEEEEGGRIFSVSNRSDGSLELQFGNAQIRFDRIRVGDILWRTSDPNIEKTVRPFLAPPAPVQRQPLQANVRAHAGEPLQITWTLKRRTDISVTVTSAEPLAVASTRTITEEQIREQVGRLGSTAYFLHAFSADMVGNPFVPVSQINQLRRQAIHELQRIQSQIPPTVTNHVEILQPPRLRNQEGQAELHILLRTPEQLDAAIDARPSSITLDYLDLYGLKPSVERVRSAEIPVRVAAPRILKPGEERIVDFLIRLDTDILVRSNGLLATLSGRTTRNLIGDFSLNAANSFTANLLLNSGLARLTPTHDLNAAQIASLAETTGSEAIEAICYGHLPVFHTEHCVFCRFLSTGTSFKDCGRPCEKHTVSLRDLTGRAHPLTADIGCRNTVFGAEAQEASAHLRAWRAAGIRHFRIEFAHESNRQVKEVISLFRRALDEEISFSQLSVALKNVAPQGTTEGSLFIPLNHLSLTVLQ